jgi:glycyl-tRNA synthetase beta chain
MRWDDRGLRFARPIRWGLALYGSTPIRCQIGRLASAPRTWIGGPLRPRPVAVRSVADYQRALRRDGVILEPQLRRSRIEQMVTNAARRLGGRMAPEMAAHGLLDEVTHLVERPTPLVGGFDPRYLELPREVLLASMAKYQRVFAVASRAGKLLPHFVAILDGKPKRPAAVQQTIEHILNARLADSLLFWTEDRKRLPLGTFGPLQSLTFHERLGSMEEKTQRLDTLRVVLSACWRLSDEEQRHLERACLLAKRDLLSAMVREFPTLQGVMGKHYARASHELEAVALAIEEHYLPSGDRVPDTLIGQALSLLDKYDTLASYFAIGIEPTGDQDPFGLRRAAQGIVQVAWAARRPLPLNRLLETRAVMPPFLPAGTADPVTASRIVGERITAYLSERLSTFEWPKPTPSQDHIAAVLAIPGDDLVDAMERIATLARLNGHAGLRRAAKVVERTHNILKGAGLSQVAVDPDRLREPLEQQLWQLYQTHAPRLTRLIEAKAYEEATTRFGEIFFEPLHRFFDQVLVNVPEEPLRQNRLALMHTIRALYTDRVADLSKLTLVQHEEPNA